MDLFLCVIQVLKNYFIVTDFGKKNCQGWCQPPMAWQMEICYQTASTPTLKYNRVPSNESLQTWKYNDK
jgi:hypothetical protein